MYRRKPKTVGYWWFREWNASANRYKDLEMVFVFFTDADALVYTFNQTHINLSSIHQKSKWEKVRRPSNE